MYPQHDDQFEDVYLSKVTKQDGGWSVQRSDGWGFYIPGDSPITPEDGMPARFYGKGIGHTVRGLFLAGAKVFYRTEEEEKAHHEIMLYGADIEEWLRRWDEGRSVWSVEMGGLGPGYEQCIQITAAEVMRHLVSVQYDVAQWNDKSGWDRDLKEIETMSHENAIIKTLGLSGAQWGAAMNLALQFYRRGPRATLTDDRVKDRLIQVQRTFPQAAAA